MSTKLDSARLHGQRKFPPASHNLIFKHTYVHPAMKTNVTLFPDGKMDCIVCDMSHRAISSPRRLQKQVFTSKSCRPPRSKSTNFSSALLTTSQRSILALPCSYSQSKFPSASRNMFFEHICAHPAMQKKPDLYLNHPLLHLLIHPEHVHLCAAECMACLLLFEQFQQNGVRVL